MGHRSAQTTEQVYIALSRAQRRQLVDAPWLRDRGAPSAAETLRRQGEECAAAICSPFGSADGRTFPTLRFDRSAAGAAADPPRPPTTTTTLTGDGEGPLPPSKRQRRQERERALCDLVRRYIESTAQDAQPISPDKAAP